MHQEKMNPCEKIPPYGMPVTDGPGEIPEILPGSPGFGAPPDPNATPSFAHEVPSKPLRPQVKIVDAAPVPVSDLVAKVGGEIAGGIAERLTIDCDEPYINGVHISGQGSYLIKDAGIDFRGDGINDFSGNGAGVQIADTMSVTLADSHITTAGVIRPCTFVGDYATLVVKNCELTGNGGVLPPDAPKVIGPGMTTPPGGLGIGGNCRTHLSVGSSHTYFYDSKIIADGWAALSTDACYGDLYLEANNCDVIVRNTGYGAYSDRGGTVALNDCRVKTVDFSMILAGRCKGFFNRCQVKTDRYAAMMHVVFGNTGEITELTMNGGEVQAGEGCVWVKSSNAYLNLRGLKFNNPNGYLIRSTVNDDTMAVKVAPGEKVYGIKAALSDMDVCGNISHEDTDREMAISMLHTKLQGFIANAYVQFDPASRFIATGDSNVKLVGTALPGQIDALPGVTVTLTGADHKLQSGALPSGGVLNVIKL